MLEQNPPLMLRWSAVSLALLPTLGCSAASTESEPVGQIVAVDELEADYRRLLETYGEGGPEWERVRAGALADPAQARFLVDNIAREMVRAFERTDATGLAQSKSPNARAFARAQAELVALSDASVPLLVGMVESGDGVLAYLGADTLKRVGAPAIEAVLPLLDSPDEQARRRAAELLGEVPAGGAAEADVQARLAAGLESEPSWIVRAQIAEALGARSAYASDAEDLAIVLQRATRDEDLAVAGEAARALGRVGDPRAVPAIVDMLSRAEHAADGFSSRAAQEALLRLSRTPLSRSASQWRAWWTQHGDALLQRHAEAAKITQ